MDGPMEKWMSYVAFLNALFFFTSLFFPVSLILSIAELTRRWWTWNGFVVPVKLSNSRQVQQQSA
ncbi:hypothetical protein COCHEDRAFT_1020774, partial [Bipolaris maydis C5]